MRQGSRRSLAPLTETGATKKKPSSSPSTTTPMAASVNWSSLSHTGKRTLRIAALISEGFSPAEIAASLGIPKEQISENIKALRWEIRSKLMD